MVLLSIIMPVYNMSEYICDSLNSIYNQTFHDFEIICIDDCSTDNSFEILNNCSANEERLSVYQMKENSGAGKCRNLGLSKAKGKYVAFLDSDDEFYDKNALKILIKKAEETNSHMVSGNVVFKSWDSSLGEYVIRDHNSFFRPSKIMEKTYPDEYGMPWYYYRSIFRLDFLKKNHINFPDLKRGQDTVFLATILSKIDNFIQIPVKFYQYSVPLETKLDNSIKYIDYFRSFKMVLDIFLENNLIKLFETITAELLKYATVKIPEFTKSEYDLLKKEFIEIKQIFTKYDDLFLLNEVKKVFRTISTVIENRFEIGEPLVSIIVPVFNVEEYLDDCINSLISQTYENIEILCVEDCSDDSSREILEYYANKDNRLKIIYNETNSGLGASRNNALEVVAGKYLLFIDSDDWLDEFSIEKLVACAEENETEVLMFKMINYLQDEDKFYHEEYYDMPYMLEYENKLFNYRTIPKDYSFRLSVSACHKLYLTSFIKDINVQFPVGVINEDNPFFYEVLFEANRYYLIDEYYYNRRRRANSITTQNDSFMITAIKMAEMLLKLFKENGFYEKYKKNVLDKVIFTIRYKYEKISETYKEDFYNECLKFVEKIVEFDMYTDLFEELNDNNKKFVNNLIYSSDYEEFMLNRSK